MINTRSMAALTLVLAPALVLATLAGCADETLPQQRTIRGSLMPQALGWMRSDIDRMRRGVAIAGNRFGEPFLVEDGEVKARRLRRALGGAIRPPRAISELFPSPLSFVAAVGTDGVVITRESDTERMIGMNVGEMFPVVRGALDDGGNAVAMAAFTSAPADNTSGTEVRSMTILAAAPATHGGQRVGAIIAGIPMWRMSRRLTEQFRSDNRAEVNEGAVYWVYFYDGPNLYHRGTPPDLDAALPSESQRNTALAASPGGYTSSFHMLGRQYAYGVVPVAYLGEGAGILIVHREP